MTRSLFEFDDYKSYLGARLSTRGVSRGMRARLSKVLKCRSAFISQVLNASSHFSLEHAVAIDQFLSHAREQSRYFMLLVQRDRAGSVALRAFYTEQLEEIRRARNLVTKRVAADRTIEKGDALKYYSTWYYIAIHMGLLVPKLQKKSTISEYFRLPLETVPEVLDFLVRIGLAEESKGRYITGTARLHLGKDSSMIEKHHMNWRLQAIRSLENLSKKENLHYSGALVLSRANAKKIEALLLDTIERIEPIVRLSGEEDAFGLCLDFFQM